MERWKILHSAKNLKSKEGTRNESCGRFGKRTPFLRWRAQLHRIRGRTLRTESLDRSNAKDSERVVRMFVEVDVVSAFLSSTTRMRVFAVRNRPLDQTNASIVKNDVRMVWEAKLHSAKFWISAKTNSTPQDTRPNAQKWNVGKFFTVRRI